MTDQELAGAGILAGFGVMMFAFIFIVSIFFVVTYWKIFTKAGQPGWAAIVPIYNLYVMMVIVSRMGIVWFVLCFVPIVWFVPPLVLPFKMAEAFGKSAGFGVGLLLLPVVFLPMLAFGSATWVGAAPADGNVVPEPAA